MPRLKTHRRNCTGLVVMWSVALASCFGMPAGAGAQGAKAKKGADSEHKTGTVAQVDKKGKTATLTVETSDGEKFDLLVTAKTNFVVNGKGDVSFFKHSNVFVSSDNIRMNENGNSKYMFGDKFTIHLGTKNPAERFESDPANPNMYLIAGPVVDCSEDSFTFEAGGTPYKVNLMKDVPTEILVESTEPEHAAVGSEVEADGITRGGKFLPSAIAVKLDKPMVADEVFAASDKKSSKSKHATASKSAKKTAKTDKDKSDKTADKGDDAATGEPVKSSDPFGILDKKDTDKKDAKKPKAAPKKDKKPAADSDS